MDFNNFPHKLFEKKVEELPKQIAAVFGEQKVDYITLNQRANQLARYLKKLGVTADDLAAIYLNRGLEIIITMLACLKAGVGYVPIDPSYPKARIEYMLYDSKVKFVLSTVSLKNSLYDCLVHIPKIQEIFLDDSENKILLEESDDLESPLYENSIAYVIYTSGSTGKPKGVVIEQLSLANFLTSMQQIFQLHKNDRLLAVTPISFDISWLELFLPLVCGAQVIIANEDAGVDGYLIQKYFETHNITIMQATPITWQILLESDWKHDGKIKVLCGGEALSTSLAARLISHGYPIWNMYGPTETTIWSSCQLVSDIDKTFPTVPIGQPIQNTQYFILNDREFPVKEGEAGELYIGGLGLARGYLHRPELTQERFVEYSFNKGQVVRLYRTGDLVRCLSNDSFYYIERADTQVKIRGFRVELNEINAYLLEHPEIEQSVVLAECDEDNHYYLIAYLIVANKINFDIERLKQRLKQFLPEYMIPAAFVLLDELPLTPNRKVDRKALSSINAERVFHSAAYISPKTPIQKQLLDYFSELLGVLSSKISILDNFFHIGGHSLLGIRLINRINENYLVTFTVKDLFELPTILMLSQKIKSKHDSSASTVFKAQKSNRQKSPLSFGQKRIYYFSMLMPELPLYNVPIVFKAKGEIDVFALEESLLMLMQRHSILRVQFIQLDNNIYQEILPIESLSFSLGVEDVSMLEEAVQHHVIRKFTQQPFNLFKDLLLRAQLFQVDENSYYFVICMHHIITDGWSEVIFLQELEVLYQSRLNCIAHSLPDLSCDYDSFIRWEQLYKQQDHLIKQIYYWKIQLADIPKLNLPFDKYSLDVQNFQGKYVCFTITKKQLALIERLSQNQSVTLFSVLLSCFALLLSRYCNQEDFAIGIPVAGRQVVGFESLIGFFVNTLVLRCDLRGVPTFVELINRLQAVLLEAYANQDVPFEKLVEVIKPERDKLSNPLFQVMIVLEPLDQKELNLKGLETVRKKIDFGYTLFDLTLVMRRSNKGLSCFWEYNCDRFSPAIIERMVENFQVLLDSAIEKADAPLTQLSFLTPKEKQILLVDWNDTKRNYPIDKTVHQLFEEQVVKTPNNIAIVFEDQQLTYRELNERANQLAHYLINIGVKIGDFVIIYLERSIELIISILAILKAGAAYIPVDSDYPLQRIVYFLRDSQSKFLLTQALFSKKLSSSASNIILIDVIWCQAKAFSHNNPGLNVSSMGQIYMIYTSGSTGKPKGVINIHQSLCSKIRWMQETYQVSTTDVFLQKTSISFDVSAIEFYLPLSCGAKLIIAKPGMHKDPEYLKKIALKNQVTFIQFVPSMLFEFLNNLKGCQGLSLKYIICAGEVLSINLQKRFFEKLSNLNLHNLYGPTEAAIYSICWKCSSKALIPTVPIGRPIANTTTYILDKDKKLLPIGAMGELYVGGDGVAKGYLNRPELTKEKFIPDPFSTEPGARLYKTGDLARWLPDGNLEFIGRIDEQIKIRGFRVELGEIESALRDQREIEDSVVLYLETQNEEKALVAFIVLQKTKQNMSKKTKNIGTKEVRNKLKQHLPDYMIPAKYLFLDELPLTPNGKIDKKTLAEISGQAKSVKEHYRAPRNTLESKIVAIWSDLLNYHKIGIGDDFFALGGHSLLALQLIDQMNKVSPVKIAIRDLFQYPTIVQLSDFILNQTQCSPTQQFHINTCSPLVPLRSTGEKNPIFIIHPVGGTVFWYKPLSNYLLDIHPVYGLQDPGIDAQNVLFHSIEEMANHYISAIKTIQAEGPYYLAGSSFGATVAVAMTHQLKKQGESVAFLGLLDGWAFYPEMVLDKSILKGVMDNQHQILKQQFKSYKIEGGRFLLDLQLQRSQLLSQYALPTINQKITLFKANDLIPLLQAIQAPDNHWQQHSVERVKIYNVPGFHETMLLEPNVKILAKYFNESLDIACS